MITCSSIASTGWLTEALSFRCLNSQSQGVMGLSQVGQSPLLLLHRHKLLSRAG